jgi:phosphoacetylglucosamine mutase
VCALRSMVCAGKCTGLMITASHNPWSDNGVKIVDVDGCMLSRDWEEYATCVANATSAGEMLSVTDEFLKKLDVVPNMLAVRVHVARDTRVTGPDILSAFQGAASTIVSTSDAAPMIDVVDHGITTTPQLHTMVYIDNHRSAPSSSKPPTQRDYYSRIAEAFSSLTALSGSSMDRQRVVIDCGNGVGALSVRNLLQAYPEVTQLLDVVLVNDLVDIPEILNDHCGADYVQKAKDVPQQFFSEFDKDPSALFFSFDGDADRVVAFHIDAATRVATLLDGDRIAILLTTLISDMMRGLPAEVLQSLDIGIVQTAYANGASTAFVEETLKLRTYCAATGVKHLHPVAEARDIGVYFEANGHGTVLFHMETIEKRVAPYPDVLHQLKLLSTLLSQVCGDALSDMLAVVLALWRLKWTSREWVSMYSDLPSVQLKVFVHAPNRIRCTSDERRAVAPDGLQQEIDVAVANTNDGSARSFVRPSGTEPLVRIYAEAATEPMVRRLSSEVEEFVKKYCSDE